jgi:SAM-dependent methyltransferase
MLNHLKPHNMLPDRDHDEQARQDFVASLRSHLASRIMPGNAQLYKTKLKSEFIDKHKRPPKDFHEIKEIMTQNDYYQFWSAMQRRSQEMMWDAVIDPTERQLDKLIEQYQTLSKKKKTGGTLVLDPELEIPRYHTAADIHIQPGGYHTEFTKDDVAAGAIYEGGLPIYIGGALGPNSDFLGKILTHFIQKEFADFKAEKILDMGCAVGNSTLPWHEAFPEASLYAIDVAAPCLRYAHARAELYGVPVHFSQQNAETTNFNDNSMDLVVSHIMLHETSRSALSNIFKECLRILKPGGMMLHLEIPRGSEPFEQFMFQWETYNNNETFARYMTEMNLPELAIKSGFHVDKTRIIGADSGFNQDQKNYTDGDFLWPILYGEK